MTFFDDEPPPALGVVVDCDRGSLPFALLHGEALVVCAAWAMGEAGIRLLDASTGWGDVREAGAALVWHDALCPMTPPDFLAACVRRAVAEDAVVVGVLPVTDTVKQVVGSPGGPVVGATLDRDLLVSVASPLVFPPGAVAALADWPSLNFAVAVAAARTAHAVVFADAPTTARRVESTDDVRALETLTRR